MTDDYQANTMEVPSKLAEKLSEPLRKLRWIEVRRFRPNTLDDLLQPGVVFSVRKMSELLKLAKERFDIGNRVD